jgi:putative ABC transport system permease protein
MSWSRFFRRAKWDRERLAEMESYIQIETDENVARGMTPKAARQAACRKLGNTTRIREEIYRMNTIGFIDSLGRDLRYALRAMRRRPTFTAAAVLTLALGIGASAAVFSVVNGVLIKPLPYPNADELVSIWHAAPGLNSAPLNISSSMYYTYGDESRSFQHIGLWSTGGQSITGLGEPEQVRAAFVTYGTLHALGVPPMLGRGFTKTDETPGTDGPNPVILTYGYWQRRFGGDPSAIGRSLTVDSRPSEIVGIMPEAFRFHNFDPEVILVIGFNRGLLTLGTFGFQGLARLKPGVTLAEANADVERMLPIWLNAWPPPPGAAREVFENWKVRPALRSLKDDLVGNVSSMLWVIMGTIGIVLLIACANVANLMLVRADGRRQEFAVRAALGAGRGRIAGELFVESLVLGTLGGALGLGLAYGMLALLRSIGPANLPRLQEISVDPLVVVFTLAASLISTLLFGSIPAMRHMSQLASNLAVGSRGASTSRERHRTRNALVVVQVALALVLLVSSGLMIRTFMALRSVEPGFVRAGEIQTARIWIPPSQIGDPLRVTRMQHDILNKIGSIPGVVSVAFAGNVPMDGRASWNPVLVEGRTYGAGDTPPIRRYKFVSPGYFKTMGTRLIAGRDMTWTDIHERRRVAVISENFAREQWGNPADAIGKGIREPGGAGNNRFSREVIGVVQDVYEDGPHQKAPSIVYWPVMMEDFFGTPTFSTRAIAFVIRSDRSGNESLLSDVREAVWSVNPSLPVFLINTMKELYDRALARTSFTLAILAIAGAMALILGLIGMYGVIAYTVSQRTREIGIRMALGAEQRSLKRMFVWKGLLLAGIGAAIGIAAAAGVTRFMSSLLYGISPLDPMTFSAVLLVLLTAAALASYVPARRASSVDPVDAMKMD